MNQKTKEEVENIEENEVLSQTALDENKILNFWKDNDIFKLSVEKKSNKKEFIFYDGPPFATGIPHFGNILAGTIKDVIPRYKTMKGYKVVREWGWDCHGLPIENIIEKELNFNSKEDIEDFGIEKFQKKCQDCVLKYEEEWKKIIPKTGRWVNMESPYKTMDSSYTESLWWAFSELNKKKLIKKDFKIMHVCPRCETSLSNNEVTEGYKNIKSLSLTAKFELEDEENTFLLAWTTTPWTFPGNVALVVGKKIEYIKVKNSEDSEKYIFAKALFKKIQSETKKKLEIIDEFLGEDLIGKSYIPLFDYYSKNKDLNNRENGWKVYPADYVNTESGTGIVHTAPAFGEDDLETGRKNNLPWIQHIEINGKLKKEVSDFSGLRVKKKENSEEVDIEITKFLAHSGKLFSKEKYEHSYPHCWRCHTPLLNYATDSWFIDTPKIKEQLLKENSKISWIPKHIGEKRLHNWLESTRPWAVSRSRYWGAPLPIWENKDTGDYKIISSLEELKNKTRSKNNYILFRHGESEANVSHTLSFEKGKYGDKLTLKGKEKVIKDYLRVLKVLKKNQKNNNGEKIDLIISSPFERTTETSKILKEKLKVKEIIFDDRLRENNFGNKNNGLKNEIYKKLILEENFLFDTKIFEGGESQQDVKKRIMEFFYEIDKKYQGKNILIVSHYLPIIISLFSETNKNNLEFKGFYQNLIIENAYPYFFDFAPLPHDKNYNLNFHRPFIDQISWTENNKKYEYIKEVFDCWFESGSMPFASKHYPFENKNIFNPEKKIGYPADFISEGQDQTRGWFHSMLVLSTALFGKSSFKNVIVSGLVLAEDGKKMSKSLKNYPDINEFMNKYGADSMRYYLMSSSAVRSESLNFTEKGVDEVMKKIVLKTKNILDFYLLYKNDVKKEEKPEASKNVLDIWILEKIEKLLKEVSDGFENYKLDEATKPIINFVEDFSTWYIRRSRDRYKGEDQEDKDFSLATTKKILKIFSKIIAPTMPFLAEILWQELRNKDEFESVHLETWPEIKKTLKNRFFKSDILETMEVVRKIVSLGLEARVVSGLKVKQPLESALVIGIDEKMNEEFSNIIKDELNIKNIMFENNLEKIRDKKYFVFEKEINNISVEKQDKIFVILNKNISEDLKKEGNYREFLRQIQKMRKAHGLQVQDNIELKIDIKENEDFIEDYKEDLRKKAGVVNINYSDISDKEFVDINGIKIKIILIK